MPKVDDATAEQCGMALTLLEVPCSCVVQYRQGVVGPPSEEQLRRASLGHKRCHGTGKVAKYPMLRQWCRFAGFPTFEHNLCGCGGRGWLLMLTEKALLEAIKSFGYSGCSIHFTQKGFWAIPVRPFNGREYIRPQTDGDGDTLEEALIRALCKAEGIEEVG